MAGGILLEVDASDLLRELKRLEGVLTPEQIERCMARIFRRVPGHMRSTLPREFRKHYVVKTGQVRESISGAHVTYSGSGAGCIIPIRGKRIVVGQGGFASTGGRRGWNTLRKNGKYRVKARIVTAGQSTLPERMKTGYPPFQNFSATKIPTHKVFKRLTKKRLPIQSVVDIAVPQMPLNRSRKGVEKDIRDYMYKRMEHEIQRMIAGK